MKVKCIDNHNWEKELTINKIYDVFYKNNFEYKITNDLKEECLYLKERFQTIEEKESDNMTYKIYEVLKMIEKDKSLVFTDNIYDVFYDKEYEVVRFKNKAKETLNLKGIGFSQVFYLVEKSVTFEEVLNSNKLCKVKHDLIKKRFDTSDSTTYELFDEIIAFLSNNLNDKELKEVIKNGKWYLED